MGRRRRRKTKKRRKWMRRRRMRRRRRRRWRRRIVGSGISRTVSLHGFGEFSPVKTVILNAVYEVVNFAFG